MVVELVPVIEIGYNNQGIKEPDKYPYWEYSKIWDKYNENSYVLAGFKNQLITCFPGSSFYKLADITDTNLSKLVIDYTEEMRNGKYGREQACSFFGGYVLRINGKDEYYPQCCGQLSDIIYWERLADGKYSYYEGHPAPKIEFEDNTVILNLSVDEFDEPFQPTPNRTRLKVDISALKSAVEIANTELNCFGRRLVKINQNADLGIIDIDKLLIWEDGRHE